MEMDNQQNGAAAATADSSAQEMPAAETNATQGQIEALQKQLDEANAKATENLAGWQRERAEFSNYKKRQDQQMADLRAFSTVNLIKRLLPIQDDFERAQKTLPEGISHMTWIEGVMLIQRKLQMLLESEGVKTIEVKPNDEFDPNLHEAISHDDADGIDSGHVIEMLQTGYKIGERVIRPALVRVAR
jgi:molecular chaperone GrpE